MADQDEHINEIFDHMLEGCQIIGFDWQYLYINDVACTHAHKTREELAGHKMMEVYPGIENTLLFEQLTTCMEKRQSVKFKNEFSYPDYTSGWFEISVFPVKAGILVMTLDITEHSRSERRIERLNRVYVLLSDINQAIIRLRSLEDLFEKACQIAVDKGSFQMACIATLDAKTGKLGCVARSGGSQVLLDKIENAFNAKPYPPNSLRTSLNSGIYWLSNDLLQETDPASWQSEAVRLGYQSCIIVPLTVAGKLQGVLTLFTPEKNFFDQEELRLLEDLAMDLSFAMEHSIAEDERRQVEEALRLSEIRFRTLIDQAPIAIAVSRESKFLYVNPAYLTLHGILSTDELIGHPIFERVAPQSLSASQERASRRAQGLPVDETYELTSLRTDGSEVPTLAAVARVNLADGLATVGFFQDISELKRVQHEIQLSEARDRNLFDNMLEGFAFCKMIYKDGLPVDFTCLHVNNAFGQLTGLYDVEGKNVTDIIPRIYETNPELFEIYGRVALTGMPEKFETYLPALDIWFSISVYSPEKEFFVAVFENFTARRLAEEALKKTNEELEQRVEQRTAELNDLYNDAPCGYHSLDPGGMINLVNNTELRWLGYTREEVVGKKGIMDLMTAESIQVFNENFPGFKERGWVNDLEFDLVRKDGSILPILLSGTAVKDSEGRYLYSRSTMIDNTERKRAERARQETQKKLEAANVELEAFAYSVSHDLRAPLRAIDGFSRILAEEYEGKLDDEADRLLGIIQNNTRRMDQLITDLLDLSRVTRTGLHLSNIDMTNLANSVFVEIASPEIRQGFTFLVNPLPAAYSDSTLIRQVWSNLLGNAVKYTLPNAEHRIEVGSYQEMGMNVYYVKDTGVGFNLAYVGKLFGVFQRLHKVEEFEGTGVGLAIVRRIITRLGGLTWAEGEVGKGATFYFSLPRKETNNE